MMSDLKAPCNGRAVADDDISLACGHSCLATTFSIQGLSGSRRGVLPAADLFARSTSMGSVSGG
jgi:hypothetical protein